VNGAVPALRLDKWLWFARIVKTRDIARELAESGHVRVNGQRVTSASRLVRPADVLTVALPTRVRVLRVTDIAERRGPAPEGAALYEELAP
jgi:ribosome-associated heat shock protein Hsp15